MSDPVRQRPGGKKSQLVIVQVPGRPVAKGRPRLGRHGVYTPERTSGAQEVMVVAMRQACSEPLEGPLRLGVSFRFPVPKSWPKVRRAAVADGEEPWYEGRPDLDNLVKLVKDAGTGVLWRDDAQIVELEAEKVYSVEADTVINVFPAKAP